MLATSHATEAILASAIDGIVVIDERGRVLEFNPAAERLFGYERDAVLGHEIADLIIPPAVRTAHREGMQRFLDTGSGPILGRRLEVTAQRSDGSEFEVELSVTQIPDTAPPRFLGHIRDLTERRATERQVHLQAFVFDQVGTAIVALDADLRVAQYNAAAEQLYGWTKAEAIGRRSSELRIGPADDELFQTVERELLERGRWEGEYEVCRKDGTRLLTHTRLVSVDGFEHGRRGLLGVAIDVTEHAAARQRLEASRSFMQAVNEHVADALFTIDVDGRATYMNPAAERLLGYSSEELLGRVLHDVTHTQRPNGSRLHLEDCPIAATRRDGTTVQVDDDVFQRKDGTFVPVAYSAAPFASDNGDRGTVVLARDISERKAREAELQRELEALTWLDRIRVALDQDRFVLYAQPVIDAVTHAVVSHELLIRMLGDDGEVIAPGQFLPTAERYGLIAEIDRWVAERAVALAAGGLAVQLNLSGSTMADPGVLRCIEDLIAARPEVAPRLTFEITETALIANEQAARGFAQRLERLGCRLALDDFGAGYAGFTYLKQLPVHVIKIDKEFVGDLASDHGSRHVVDAIVSLGRGFDAQVVAEGVEDQRTLDLVRAAGVDQAQGYFVGRPFPVERLLGA